MCVDVEGTLGSVYGVFIWRSLRFVSPDGIYLCLFCMGFGASWVVRIGARSPNPKRNLGALMVLLAVESF